MKNYQIDIPDFSPAPVHSPSVLRWMWYFIRPYKKLFWLLSANRLSRQIFFLGIQPLFIAKIIGAFETGEAFANPHRIWGWVGLYAAVSIIFYLLLLLCAEEAKLYDKVSRGARLLGLAHLNRLSVRWHEQADSGGKLQKIMNGAMGIKNLIRLYFLSILAVAAGFVGTTVAMLGMGLPWQYLALFTGMMLSYCAFAWWSSIYVARGYDRQNQLLEALVGKVYEFVNATLTVKIFNLGRHILDHARQGEQEGHAQINKIYMLDYARWIALDFIGLFWIMLILCLGIEQVLAHTLAVAAFALAGYQALRLWDMLEEFTSIYNQLVQESSATKRLIELLRQPAQEDTAAPFAIEQGEISFNNIRFAYNADENIIKDFQLTVKAGEKIGVVGRSGSGKSTLVKLLLRFYDPDENEILIDRQNIRSISRESLHQNIAVIPQEVNLFNHTILDNIRYGRLDATDDEVMNAARLAFAHEFIEKLPEGYQTLVGEHGMKLSGGQRQRIAIARAILKNAPILILDEATSALDSESEKLIQSSFQKIFDGHTVIAIAHRLSTVAQMDRLIVLGNGHIVESGTHEQLLRQNGPYAQLWAMQNNGYFTEAKEQSVIRESSL